MDCSPIKYSFLIYACMSTDTILLFPGTLNTESRSFPMHACLLALSIYLIVLCIHMHIFVTGIWKTDQIVTLGLAITFYWPS